ASVSSHALPHSPNRLPPSFFLFGHQDALFARILFYTLSQSSPSTFNRPQEAKACLRESLSTCVAEASGLAVRGLALDLAHGRNTLRGAGATQPAQGAQAGRRARRGAAEA